MGVAKQKQSRLPREQRAKQIVTTAAEFFAERGFTASTRELADRLGVTQALLYRYFASKEALIDEVFDSLYVDRWNPSWDALLTDHRQALRQRLCAFYSAFLGRGDALSLRLFIRANLDGMGFADRYRFPLTERMLGPVIGELRRELKLATLHEVPLLPEERELALVLHGGLVFSRIREHVYNAPIPLTFDAMIRLHVHNFLPGALKQVKAMHSKPPR